MKNMKLNHQFISNTLFKGLSPRPRDILEKRFGLDPRGQGPGAGTEKRTLESIGKVYGICRERVRQIEDDSFKKVKEIAKVNCQKISQHLEETIRANGNLKKEDSLISELSRQDGDKNYILFLLTIGDQFQEFKETEDFYSFWTIDSKSYELAKRVINDFIANLHRKNKPLTLKQYIQDRAPIQRFGLGTPKVLFSYLEISKRILKNPQGLYGFLEWPEINPRGVKDKAYLVLRKENRPLHFTKVAKTIGRTGQVQTTHNELIKDPRFVLVGRGIYALKEWGYQPGVVQEVIFNELKKANKPMSRPEVLKKVLKQRLVQENTILLNLNNKKYFLRDSQGRYRLRQA